MGDENENEEEQEKEEEAVEEIDLGAELKKFQEAAITYKDEISRIETATALIRNEETQVDLYSRDISNLVDLGDEDNATLYAYAGEAGPNLVKARGSYTLF